MDFGNFHLTHKCPQEAEPYFQRARKLLESTRNSGAIRTLQVRVYRGLIHCEMQMTYPKGLLNEREKHLSKAQQYASIALEIARRSPDPRDLLKMRLEKGDIIVTNGKLQAKRLNFDHTKSEQLKSDELKETLDVADKAKCLGTQGLEVADIIVWAEKQIRQLMPSENPDSAREAIPAKEAPWDIPQLRGIP
jgi:hypothetical protein